MYDLAAYLSQAAKLIGLNNPACRWDQVLHGSIEPLAQPPESYI